ncbi:transposase [Desulfurispirillum indicum]|uniref:transposase n=1 Tax=Desulfurispirillum indicum TaxID=936456 RepID=UPI0021F63754|nr:transposase [Desulfurispirillum indicum]
MQVLLIAHQMSVLKIGVVSLDGTKIKANASKHRAMSYGYAQKLEKQLLEEVQTLTGMAESADRKDVPDGMSLDEELSHRKKRLEGIADAKAEIERRAKERYQQEKREYDEKVAKRKAHEERTGKKCRGKEPKAPSEEPQEKDQVNFTDEESRIMPQSGGGFVQAYNAQAAVDANSHMIIACHTTQKPNDKLEISPSVENLRKLPEILGQPTALLADAGYYSEENVKKCHEAHMTPHISFKREKHNQTLEKRMATAPAPPECEETKDTADQWMKYRLQTLEGKELYAKRKGISETVFGIVKQVMGFRQFMLRGIDKVSGEWNLVCTAWNIRRLHALTR